MRNLRLLALLVVGYAAAAATFATGPSTVTLEVRNMVCHLCAGAVRKALEKVPGVEAAKVDLQAKRAVVTFDPATTTPQALTKATAAAGFPSAVAQTQ